jgi:D-amino-acid dehydrogenase
VPGESPPRRVAVIGAGMVGLCTAWFLQEHCAEVTVLDRAGVAAGASGANASWAAMRWPRSTRSPPTG